MFCSLKAAGAGQPDCSGRPEACDSDLHSAQHHRGSTQGTQRGDGAEGRGSFHRSPWPIVCALTLHIGAHHDPMIALQEDSLPEIGSYDDVWLACTITDFQSE